MAYLHKSQAQKAGPFGGQTTGDQQPRQNYSGRTIDGHQARAARCSTPLPPPHFRAAQAPTHVYMVSPPAAAGEREGAAELPHRLFICL